MSVSTFTPLSSIIQRFGDAYKFYQNGWVVVHIEGTPEERGEQQGRLLAAEIADSLRNRANITSIQDASTSEQAYNILREQTYSVFLTGAPSEYLIEMEHIANGANAAGARLFNKEISAVDIAILNTSNEIWSVPSVSGHYTPRGSAFIANDYVTGGRGLVMGHVGTGDLYSVELNNVYLHVVPSDGNSFVMQTTPGGITSGSDWYINDKGIVLTETTINQTNFNTLGVALAWRSRLAAQYSNSVDTAVVYLTANSNGLCSNEWLLGDINTGEIAMLQTGLNNNEIFRSSQNQWVAGLSGFYWGCNNSKSLLNRLETLEVLNGVPTSVTVFEPTTRDLRWVQFYKDSVTRLTESLAVSALTDPIIVQSSGCDYKYTTSLLASSLKTVAVWGPGTVIPYLPTAEETFLYPEVQPLYTNPQTLLQPLQAPISAVSVALADCFNPNPAPGANQVLPQPYIFNTNNVNTTLTYPWSGTFTPQTSSDIWLALAYAEYATVFADITAINNTTTGTGDIVSRYRTNFNHATNSLGYDIALKNIQIRYDSSEWREIALNKGVLLLNQIATLFSTSLSSGYEQFRNTLVSYYNTQKLANTPPVCDSNTFRAALETTYGSSLSGIFSTWLNNIGLPVAQVSYTSVVSLNDNTFAADVNIKNTSNLLYYPVVTIDDSSGTELVYNLDPVLPTKVKHYNFNTINRPIYIKLDPYCTTPLNNDGTVNIFAYTTSVTETVIYVSYLQSLDDTIKHALLEAANYVQKSIHHDTGYIAPIQINTKTKSLRKKNVIVIGGPGINQFLTGSVLISLNKNVRTTNTLTATNMFTVKSNKFTHPDSAFITAIKNPSSSFYSIIVIHGLTNQALIHASQCLRRDILPIGQTVVLSRYSEPLVYNERPSTFTTAF
jgi:hypothetical protein